MRPAAPRLPPQPTLRTGRLLLRPLELTDAADVFGYVRDPDVLRYTTGRTPARLAETEAYLGEALSSPDTYHWGICLPDSRPVVGVIEFSIDTPGRASIHYTLAAPLWGKGLMTEAVRGVCAWAFNALPDLRVIETSVAAENVGSARVLEKVGFRRLRRTEERWEKEPSPVQLEWYALGREG
jgi:RimJ/RimL family protein N-acetyltransferase